MDFVVLARKLRPARFEHLIGQDTVVRALRNAIATDRVAHAFLFAGSRGVGKTSTARILTKALNCEHPAEGEPCDACGNCREIAVNASPDVYEIDAASNRGIDNIRELRENTKYAPVKCRYKTYIIDEVHMLTMESFNALLKTLEEPPPHVKFILATTNPHRIPETIVSRCQRYDFARIPVPVLAGYLGEVTQREGIALSPVALEAIARNAAGGVRDALTAVDQVVSFAGPDASDEQVLSILGLTDNREVFTLLGAILDKALPAALEAFATIRERGHDLSVLLEALIGTVKDFSLYLSLEGSPAALSDRAPEAQAFYAERHAQMTLDELQQLFYVLLEVEEQIKRSDFAQACFEMGLVKACSVQPLVGVAELLAQVRALTGEGSSVSPGPPATTRATAPSAPAATAGASQRVSAPPDASGPAPAASSTPTAAAGDFARMAARAQNRQRESGGGRPARRSAPADNEESEPAPDDLPPPLPAAAIFAAAEGQPLSAEEPSSPVPADDGPALCDDSRWRGMVEALAAKHPRLASKLRRTEVRSIGNDTVDILPMDTASTPSAAELDAAAPHLHEAFGEAFHIVLVDDTQEKGREAHTIAGRNRIEEAARLAARRAVAAGDAQVERVLHYFPQGRIVEITLGEASDDASASRPAAPPSAGDDGPHPIRSEDV